MPHHNQRVKKHHFKRKLFQKTNNYKILILNNLLDNKN